MSHILQPTFESIIPLCCLQRSTPLTLKMHFFPLILASIFAAAATTALPHDTLPNGLSLRQDSSCAAAMSAEEVAREKLDNDKRERARIPPQVSGAQVYRDRLDLQNAQNNVVSIVILLK